MSKKTLKETGTQFLEKDSIKAVINELGSEEFKKYKDKSFEESQTAHSICIHLCLI